MLIDPSGTQGWAVGGFVDNETRRSARHGRDVDALPRRRRRRRRASAAPRCPTSDPAATFAIGGDAQCAAPCADRGKARIGPDAWLSAALARRADRGRARVPVHGPARDDRRNGRPRHAPDPLRAGARRYAQVLSSSPIARSRPPPADRPRRHGRRDAPSSRSSGWNRLPPPASRGQRRECSSAPGCQSAYYALDSAGVGGTVRVIVLDDSRDVGRPSWRGWRPELAGPPRAQAARDRRRQRRPERADRRGRQRREWRRTLQVRGRRPRPTSTTRRRKTSASRCESARPRSRRSARARSATSTRTPRVAAPFSAPAASCLPR